MPEQQVPMVERQLVPGIKVNLNFHLVAPDFLEGDQRWIHCSGGLHEHPALHLRWQQPLKALELTHRARDLKIQ